MQVQVFTERPKDWPCRLSGCRSAKDKRWLVSLGALNQVSLALSALPYLSERRTHTSFAAFHPYSVDYRASLLEVEDDILVEVSSKMVPMIFHTISFARYLTFVSGHHADFRKDSHR